MALVQSTLADELANLTPVETEAQAILSFVAAWDTYFAGASVNGVPAAGGSYAAGLTAMQGALTGMSLTGAVSIGAGVTAFWGAIAPLGATMFIVPPGVIVPPLVPPPTLGAISGLLTTVFAANTASSADAATAWANVAAVLHANGGIGGIASYLVAPAPPVPTPIL